jgi:signal transduction histidine kinase
MRGKRMHVFALPLSHDGHQLGAIAIFHDVAFIAAPVWRHALTGVAQTLLIVGMTLLIVHWSLGKPLRHMAQWLRDLRTGGISGDPAAAQGRDLSFAHERMTQLATSLHAARAAAEEEARLRDAASPGGRPKGCASRCRAN